MNDREMVIERVQAMPPESTIAEIVDELALLATVEARLQESAVLKGGQSNDQLRSRLREWTSK